MLSKLGSLVVVDRVRDLEFYEQAALAEIADNVRNDVSFPFLKLDMIKVDRFGPSENQVTKLIARSDLRPKDVFVFGEYVFGNSV